MGKDKKNALIKVETFGQTNTGTFFVRHSFLRCQIQETRMYRLVQVVSRIDRLIDGQRHSRLPEDMDIFSLASPRKPFLVMTS